MLATAAKELQEINKPFCEYDMEFENFYSMIEYYKLSKFYI